MLHIVHVLHSLGVGGTENGVVNLINSLQGEFRHTVITMTGRGPLEKRLPADTPVHCLGKRPGLDLKTFGGLTLLLRRLRPQIVHSRNWGALDAVPAARLAGVPVVIHGEHGREATDPEGLNSRQKRIRRILAPFVDRFVTVSRDLRQWLVEAVGVQPGKVVTICNGVDTTRFTDDGREAGRRKLGLPADSVVIGTVGRLDPVKNHIALLEAFSRLRDGSTSLALVIIGEGPCRSALQAEIRRLDLTNQVHLLGERSDVPVLLKGFDIFVLPSIAEGMSNTILEAMATGLPVVATRVGGNPELVEDWVTGRLVPERDPIAISEALSDYLTDPVRRALDGKASRQRAIEHFSLERMMGSYRDLYLSQATKGGQIL